MNTDTARRSAQVKFKTIEEAEAAANAFFTKARDEYILGVPQIRVKYVSGGALCLEQKSKPAVDDDPEEGEVDYIDPV